MIYDDDDEIVATHVSSDVNEFMPKVKVKIHSKAKASLEGTSLRVLLELSGQGNLNSRPGLDLVTVLDVSGSMKSSGKFVKLKTAMELVVNKLSANDRLSVITFSNDSHRLSPLQTMTDNSKEQIKLLVSDIRCMGWTNIHDGIEMGLKVLSDRKYTSRRSVGIMLMSDGVQNRGGDASEVQIGKVPVYTFCFGSDDTDVAGIENVATAIARNSYGGTFSDVINTEDLSTAFAQCLAGLLTLTVQDLELIIAPQNSTVQNVYAGDFVQHTSASSSTVLLGNLSYKETRKVIVDLVLPPATYETTTDILHVTCKFSNKDGKELSSTPIIISVLRTSKYTKQENLQVLIEANRLQAAMMMKDARILADNAKFEDARDELFKAQNMLQNVNIDNSVIDILKYEIQELSRLMQSSDIYENAGRRFALSSELSHMRQRFAGRGDTNKLRMFATPRMDEYHEQAKQYPSKPLPTIEQDLKKEQAKKRLCPSLGSLSSYIQGAIRNLRSIDNIVDRDAR